ncbi:hypothetical protein [Amycolatopsis cihanbeyliensis]|uniref:Uncharacterized protein n=1 Tax=Amycolatopsis cihanbeyliensis TaxID=1128664 RepID=A0A542DNK4_AMYCI|nr:hypothetical protein [Amycolatopsis cihanbeyliensis]TQJ04673.1 hypothetical protein FB471_4478 [Amycolatopsis cihanbeyliensis]
MRKAWSTLIFAALIVSTLFGLLAVALAPDTRDTYGIPDGQPEGFMCQETPLCPGQYVCGSDTNGNGDLSDIELGA